MRKLICVVMVFMFSLLDCSAAGIILDDGQEFGNWTYVYKPLYEIDKYIPDGLPNADFTCTINGEKIKFFDYHIDNEDLTKLKNIFSDDKLISTGEQVDKESYVWQGTDLFSLDDGISSYNFNYNEEKVLFNISEPTRVMTGQVDKYCGWFTYKDSNTYNEILKLCETMIPKKEAIEEEKFQALNPVYIKDFQIIFNAQANDVNPENFWNWGICKYTREGESNPVTMLYWQGWNENYYIVFDIEKYSDKRTNTVSLPCVSEAKRYLFINPKDNIAYERDAGDLISLDFDMQINVSENNQPESFVCFADNRIYMPIPLDKHKITGKLPSEYFKASNNVKYNKISNFKKEYVEKVNITDLLDYKDAEWGICTYDDAYGVNSKAIYLKLIDNQYHIANLDKLSSKTTNVIDFSSRYIYDGILFEVDKSAYPYQLKLEINDSKQIVHRKVESTSEEIRLTVVGYSYHLGNLDMIEFYDGEEQATKNENETSGEETKEETKTEKTEKETEKPNEAVKETDKAEVNKEQEENSDDKTVTDEPQTITDVQFTDVSESHWAFNEVNYFARNSIVLGYGNGYFGVNDSITYEHFGFLLDRLLDYNAENTNQVPAVREYIIVSVVKALGMDVSNVNEGIIEERFSDCSSIKKENRKYIAAAIEKGLVIGDGEKLFPQNNLTRAQTVVLLYRAINQ